MEGFSLIKDGGIVEVEEERLGIVVVLEYIGCAFTEFMAGISNGLAYVVVVLELDMSSASYMRTQLKQAIPHLVLILLLL